MEEKKDPQDDVIVAAWKARASRTYKHKLPSGLEMVLKRPNWMHLLKMGLIPNRLFSLVMGEEKTKINPDTGKIDYQETVSIMQAYAVGASIVPKIVMENPKEYEVSVDQIDDADLLSIFNKVQSLLASGEEGEGKSLESFSNGSQGNDSGLSGAEVQSEAVGSTQN